MKLLGKSDLGMNSDEGNDDISEVSLSDTTSPGKGSKNTMTTKKSFASRTRIEKKKKDT
jgi:hypothetical protein